MDKLFKIFTFVFALSFIVGMNLNAQDANQLNPNSLNIHSNCDFGVGCSGGHVHDDGVAENGYGWNASAGNPSAWCSKFIVPSHPYKFTKFCVGLTRTAAGAPTFTFKIVMWSVSGSTPGAILDSVTVTATGISIWPVVTVHDFNLPATWADVASGDVFIGMLYNPITQTSKYIGADQSVTTPLWPGFGKTATGSWTPIQTYFSGYRALLQRAEGGPAGGGVFFEDFEGFTVNQQVACQDSINWTTWSHDPCNATEDPLISNAQSFSPTKSMVIAYNNDLVKELGNDTTGIHLMTFKFYVPTGKTGYWNTLAGFLPTFPNKWGMECYFDAAASGNNGRLFAGSSTAFPFAYTHGAWQTALLMVNLDIDSAMFIMNGIHVRTWRWTAGANGSAVPKRLAGNNFYGAAATNELYVDNYWYNPDTSWFLTGVTQNGNTVPTEYSLSQNYPNPFNPSTKINFAIPTTGLVTMKIYDVLGKEVATLINEVKNPGNYIVEFDGGNLSSGVYFYKIQVGDFSSIKRMILVK